MDIKPAMNHDEDIIVLGDIKSRDASRAVNVNRGQTSKAATQVAR